MSLTRCRSVRTAPPNRRIADVFSTSLDASVAYEMVNFLQLERLGWEDPKTLEEPESLVAAGG